MTETKTCRGPCALPKALKSFGRVRNGKRRNVCETCRKNRQRIRNRMVAPADPTRFRRALAGQKFLITSAQNATPAHGPFLETLKRAASILGAELVIIPLRYKNPTQPEKWQKWVRDAETGDRKLQEDWWSAETKPYLFDGRKKLNPNLVLVGDVKIQPTASTPLTGFESLTGRESCIIGHPKMQLKPVAVPSGRLPKILTTTGSCTLRNYSDTRAGKVGEFHHHLGALMVEVRGKLFQIRQITADRQDGSFTDLDRHFTTRGVRRAPPALALATGDIHEVITDKAVDHATFGPGGIVETLRPITWVVNDGWDGISANPHDRDDLFIASAKQKSGLLDIRAELQRFVMYLNKRAASVGNVAVVDSNHHDFLRRWVVRNMHQGCHDAKNLGVFIESANHMWQSAKMAPGGAEYGDPFPYWLAKLGAAKNVRCLAHDASLMIGGSECALHGHNGPNGARGTVKNLSRLGTPVVSGHGHSAGWEENHVRVATSTPPRLTYQRGPSSSHNAHAVIYATGARSLIFIVEGMWRLS